MNGKKAKALRNKAHSLAENFKPMEVVKDSESLKSDINGNTVQVCTMAYPKGSGRRIYQDLKKS